MTQPVIDPPTGADVLLACDVVQWLERWAAGVGLYQVAMDAKATRTELYLAHDRLVRKGQA